MNKLIFSYCINKLQYFTTFVIKKTLNKQKNKNPIKKRIALQDNTRQLLNRYYLVVTDIFLN